MMHQKIERTFIPALAEPKRWCILRTSAGRTLALTDDLVAAGIPAWTPRRVVKRPAPGNARRYVVGRRRVMVEVTVAILPGFVFANADHLNAIFALSALPPGSFPAFSILRLGERVPLVGSAQIKGLATAETDAAAEIAAVRDAESREQARRIRAEQLGTERAKRKALRREAKSFVTGTQVEVTDMPALAGMRCTILESNGTTAKVHVGGSLTIAIEAWRIVPADVQNANTFDRAAA
ncbi:hypothetical protein [uncultured Sphingomonas sp.]|uniref:hypothetical protein n=1 Tax=uncultured Sphingomonas sp. TaxID=158754 RepID=UPI00259AC303|nr:hypothetical protein [uncultured Sphingomonas sp.]